MKKHVATFSTVTDEAIQMREGSNEIGIRRERVARVTVLDKSHRGRNALIFAVVGAAAGAGISAAASRCSNSNTSFNLLVWNRTRRRGRYRRSGWVGRGRRRRCRDTQSPHNLSRRASEIKYNPLTRCPLARVVRKAASPVLIGGRESLRKQPKSLGESGQGEIAGLFVVFENTDNTRTRTIRFRQRKRVSGGDPEALAT